MEATDGSRRRRRGHGGRGHGRDRHGHQDRHVDFGRQESLEQVWLDAPDDLTPNGSVLQFPAQPFPSASATTLPLPHEVTDFPSSVAIVGTIERNSVTGSAGASGTPFVEFEVHVRTERGRLYPIWRRYSEFFRLHTILLDQWYEAPVLPPFPAKTYVTSLFGLKQSQSELDQRRKTLQNYLNSLLTEPRYHIARLRVWSWLQTEAPGDVAGRNRMGCPMKSAELPRDSILRLVLDPLPACPVTSPAWLRIPPPLSSSDHIIATIGGSSGSSAAGGAGSGVETEAVGHSSGALDSRSQTTAPPEVWVLRDGDECRPAALFNTVTRILLSVALVQHDVHVALGRPAVQLAILDEASHTLENDIHWLSRQFNELTRLLDDLDASGNSDALDAWGFRVQQLIHETVCRAVENNVSSTGGQKSSNVSTTSSAAQVVNHDQGRKSGAKSNKAQEVDDAELGDLEMMCEELMLQCCGLRESDDYSDASAREPTPLTAGARRHLREQVESMKTHLAELRSQFSEAEGAWSTRARRLDQLLSHTDNMKLALDATPSAAAPSVNSSAEGGSKRPAQPQDAVADGGSMISMSLVDVPVHCSGNEDAAMVQRFQALSSLGVLSSLPPASLTQFPEKHIDQLESRLFLLLEITAGDSGDGDGERIRSHMDLLARDLVLFRKSLSSHTDGNRQLNDALLRRIEDLQENVTDLSHTLGKKYDSFDNPNVAVAALHHRQVVDSQNSIEKASEDIFAL